MSAAPISGPAGQERGQTKEASAPLKAQLQTGPRGNLADSQLGSERDLEIRETHQLLCMHPGLVNLWIQVPRVGLPDPT